MPATHVGATQLLAEALAPQTPAWPRPQLSDGSQCLTGLPPTQVSYPPPTPPHTERAQGRDPETPPEGPHGPASFPPTPRVQPHTRDCDCIPCQNVVQMSLFFPFNKTTHSKSDRKVTMAIAGTPKAAASPTRPLPGVPTRTGQE